MRQIVLDTETTGLSPQAGHRIIEIGAIELINRRFTGKQFHYYLHPDREIDYGAQKVHGITLDFLADKPRFPEISAALIEFIRGAELIIHNASFDIGFLNYELSRINKRLGGIDDYAQVTDSLTLARKKHPGQKNSLDALAKRYQITHFERDLHGALLDAQILAQVYLAMTGGQDDLSLDMGITEPVVKTIEVIHSREADYAVIYADAEESNAHEAYLQKIKEASRGKCVWLQD
jgi:DNA polymerase III subunit epsilon